MEKTYAKYMKWGKLVKLVEEEGIDKVYKLIEDMDASKDIVKAVNMDNWRRYELLVAWERNWEQNSLGFRARFTKDIGVCKRERQSYEEYVNISEIAPHNIVRFITPDYRTKFEATDLSKVFVGEKIARIVYLDECHFTFADTINLNLYGGCLHICQFAEICEIEGLEVMPFTEENNDYHK